jgi:mono/diheme cytochrome c family protein
MSIRIGRILVWLVALIVVVVIGGISMVGWQVVFGPKMRKATDRKFDPTPVRQARGEYLVTAVANCFHCHTEHDLKDPEGKPVPGKMGAGWHLPVPELGDVVAPNITPDKETGIGTWTDDEIARAFQEGVDKDGRALFPIMPWMNFRNLDEEDVASIVVYLRSIPAVKNALPVSKLIFPLSILVKTMPQPLESHTPASPRMTAEDRGKYLVRNLAGCQDCHTAADDKGQPLAGMEFGGGGAFTDPIDGKKQIFSINITQDPSGIAHYDEAMFMNTLKTGMIAGRKLSYIMPFEGFRYLKDDDLKDIWAYIKSVPPVKHRVSNTDPPTKCPVCNQTHGLGDLNIKPLK